MMDNLPGPIIDDAAKGEVAEGATTITGEDQTITIFIPFDDSLEEFKLWEYLYDRSSKFELEPTTDFKGRNEVYEVTGLERNIQPLKIWLKKNNFSFKA